MKHFASTQGGRAFRYAAHHNENSFNGNHDLQE